MIWLADSRETIRGFPDNVRRIAGFQLWRVQRELEPNDWKPMSSVGLGVQEIRIRTAAEHRVLYVAKFARRSTSCTPLKSERGKHRRPTLISPDSGCARL